MSDLTYTHPLGALRYDVRLTPEGEAVIRRVRVVAHRLADDGSVWAEVVMVGAVGRRLPSAAGSLHVTPTGAAYAACDLLDPIASSSSSDDPRVPGHPAGAEGA